MIWIMDRVTSTVSWLFKKKREQTDCVSAINAVATCGKLLLLVSDEGCDGVIRRSDEGCDDVVRRSDEGCDDVIRTSDEGCDDVIRTSDEGCDDVIRRMARVQRLLFDRRS